MHNKILLGVNIDHVATIRQARCTTYPDPVQIATLVELGGADSITVHLREDRRHILDRDVELLKHVLSIPLNLEMALDETIVKLAEKIKPAHCCLVPEKREELTTEGGLDVVSHFARIQEICQRLQALQIEVALFIEPDQKQIAAAKDTGAKAIEIHTGDFANATTASEQQSTLRAIQTAATMAAELGLVVNAGHGLHYQNVTAIAAIAEMTTLNIGHAIVARALFSGMQQAVQDMKQLMTMARMWR